MSINKSVIDKYYKPSIKITPRNKDPIYIPPKEKKEKPGWDFDKSLFKDY